MLHHDGVFHSLLAAKHDSRLRSGGFPLGGSLSMWSDIWAFKSVHFADANHDSRLVILPGLPGVSKWSSASPNHDSSLAIWTAKSVILQMLITIVA